MKNENTIYHVNHVYYDSPIDYDTFKLIQIGRRYCAKGSKIGTHWQGEYYEMTVITDGVGFITTNGIETPVKAGDIYFSFQSELHDLRASDKDKFEYDFFSFCPGPIFEHELSKLSTDFYNPTLRVFQDERVANLVAIMISEVSKEKPYSKELVASCFNQIIIYTLRRFAKIEKNATNVSDAEVLCQQIMTYIDTNVYSLTNLSELSKKFGYNYTYISAFFKRTTGNTLLDYHRKRKLEVAKALLNEKKITVGKIAERLGYSSPFAFSTAFKKMYGISPKEYQKSNLR